jgi:ribulose-phosphate 3-epimerase
MIGTVRPRPLLSASILAADFTRLGESIREAEAGGADWIHIDVMDGHFVPNLTIGPVVIEACRRATRLPLDVHLMVEKPEPLLPAFAQAGADILTVHVEACPDILHTLHLIHDLGTQAGVALSPGTPAETVIGSFESADLVLVMSVEPGYAGQAFLPSVLEKLRHLRGRRPEERDTPVFEIDGGVSAATAPGCAQAGAEVFVAASAIFGHPQGIRAGLAELRSALGPGPS